MALPPAAQQPQPLQPRPKVLNFITGNANKLAEVRAILGDVPGLDLQSRNVEGVEIQGTIEEVARDKASRAARTVSASVQFIGLFGLAFDAVVGCVISTLSLPRGRSQWLKSLALRYRERHRKKCRGYVRSGIGMVNWCEEVFDEPRFTLSTTNPRTRVRGRPRCRPGSK